MSLPEHEAPKTFASVLIVDDNEADARWCMIVCGRTDRYPYLMHANTGPEALAMFAEPEASRRQHPDRFPPDLILLDINMPVMDGFEFLDRLEALYRDRAASVPPVVLMLSLDNERDRERASTRSCVVELVTKPLTQGQAVALADRFGAS